ncbi:MAG: geranylgeranyl reductase family protein [Bacteroidota bacterium]
MHNHYTTIIIGGGPAGSSAAHTLAKAGNSVCLVDKSEFPRDKLCGGFLTLRSKKVFEQVFGANWDEAYEFESSSMKLFYQERLLNSVEDYSQLYFCQRYHFDDYLLRLAEGAGADCRLGASVTQINLEKRVCQLRSGEEITYDYLIGADGANSFVAKTVFGASFNKDTIGFGLECELPREILNGDAHLDTPEVYFGLVKWGYGWVFPKKETLTFGIGGRNSINSDFRRSFHDLLEHRFGNIAIPKIKGHYLPCGDYRKQPGKDNVLLVGDAAGLVEPVTGEGIAFAMQSGYLAAQAIIENVATKAPIKNLYSEYTLRYVEIFKILRYARVMSYLLFPSLCQKALAKVLPRTSALPRMHMDLMADEIGYPDYARYFVKNMPRGIWRQITS